METKEFIRNYREAFVSKASLPLLFGYSGKPIADTEKTTVSTSRLGGCFFRGLQAAREGQPVSLSVGVIGCGGGKLYTGFSDMLSGLCGWAFFDNNEPDAVVSMFGSGCSSVVSLTVAENRRGGSRCFLGLFDPSVRPYVGKHELSFTIPYSRFVQMTETMRECFLFDIHAWAKVKARLEE